MIMAWKKWVRSVRNLHMTGGVLFLFVFLSLEGISSCILWSVECLMVYQVINCSSLCHI